MIHSRLHSYIGTLLEVLVLHMPLTFVNIIVNIYDTLYPKLFLLLRHYIITEEINLIVIRQH